MFTYYIKLEKGIILSGHALTFHMLFLSLEYLPCFFLVDPVTSKLCVLQDLYLRSSLPGTEYS